MKPPYPPLKIILWTAEWCAPCQALKKAKTLEKAIEALATAGHFGTLEVRDVDAPEWETVSDDEDVQSMPTIDLIYDGQRLSRIIGAHSQKVFANRWLKALTEAA